MDEFVGRILIVLCLYAISATVSGAEASFFSLKPHDYDRLGRMKARVLHLLARPRRLLIVILTTNLLVNTTAAALVEGIAVDLLGPAGLGAAIFFAGILVLIFGEVVPQTFALNHRVGFASAVAPFISLLELLWRPLAVVLVPLTKVLTRRFEGDPDEKVTEDDIKSLVQHSQEIGALESSVEQWIHSIFELDKLKALDLMTPLDRMIALPKDVEFDVALAEIMRTRYSRIPLYAGERNQIVGVLYAKDMLVAKAGGITVKPARIARKPVFVPRWKRCDYLLNDLRGLKTHLAIVVDEFGGVLGMITLEDILEAIVGKIRDTRRGTGPGPRGAQE